jgi:hypothetical protein
VHIACAWFIEEISFKNIATMEPTDGLANINPSRFQQVKICVCCLYFIFIFVLVISLNSPSFRVDI